MPDLDAVDMREVQAGRLERFALLVDRHQSACFRYAQSRLGARGLAEDAVQEAFLAAFEHRASFDPDRSFRTWLFTILVNQCRRLGKNELRRQAGRRSFDAAAHVVADDADQPLLDRLTAAEDQQLLAELLASLPDEQADAVRMRFFGELTFDEIAQVQGTPTPTVKSRVRYALERMTAEITRRETKHEAAR
ncbi:MAG: RNA polymerase sigma factor [Planctomycetia bacterium]